MAISARLQWLLLAALPATQAWLVLPTVDQRPFRASGGAYLAGAQNPLRGPATAAMGGAKKASAPLQETGEFPVFWQNETTCNGNTAHFTGKVPVAQGKELFFWFVESREDALEKPTVMWLNGGPGGSSMVGLFEEVGPCEFVNESSTKPNPYSWANFANLLFLDQPAGVGFSTVDNDEWPTTLGEASVDFSAFLSRFVEQFPQYFAHGLYITGESFAGRYLPYFTADIAAKQQTRAPDAIPVDVKGMVLVNALVDGAYTAHGHYEMFCTDTAASKILRFNESTCAAIAAAMPEAERLNHLCRSTNDAFVCGNANAFNYLYLHRYFQEEVDAQRRSPYDLRLGCERPPICIPPMEFSVEAFLSTPRIQKQLGISGDQKYNSINFELNTAWSLHPEIAVPTTRQVTYLLDVAKVPILVVNGNYDVAITSTGAFREYDELPWSENIQFRLDARKDWFYTDANGKSHKGGQIKGPGRLKLAGVDDAGHMSPGDQKESVSWLVGEWLADIEKSW